MAAPAPARTFREGQTAKALRFARSCYDHLAGRLGVQLADALTSRRCLVLAGRDYRLASSGSRLLAGLEVDVEGARGARRSFARACLDWSERRRHLAGALGAALLDRLLELRWLERTAASRALRLTEAGRRGLRDHLRVAAG